MTKDQILGCPLDMATEATPLWRLPRGTRVYGTPNVTLWNAVAFDELKYMTNDHLHRDYHRKVS